MNQEKINLNVVAEFELDKQGKPAFIESNGLKHYKIKLHTNQIDTSKVDTVVYKLHPTYYDNERVVVAKPSVKQYEFPESITSYGDFKIAVSGSGIAGDVLTSKKLSDALAEAYKSVENTYVQVAIDEIKHL